ncbi:MAG: GspE/PulE family protein, partial [Thermoplasmata archaeon]
IIKPMVTGRKGLEKGWTRLYGDDLASFDTLEETDPVSLRKQKYQISKASIDMKQLDAAIDSAIDEAIDLEEGREMRDKSLILQLEISSERSHIIKLVNSILLKAVKMRATDIHIEPFKDEIRARFRIDGALSNIKSLPKSALHGITSRIKIMSGMDIAERRIPQDGGFRAQFNEDMMIDFRVSTLPGINGEKMVLRIIGQAELRSNVSEIGFRSDNLRIVNEALKSPYGMILVTGPTGSGKTTTLYTILQQLNTQEVNILTAEDPVEYHLNGITQINVRPAIGFNFGMALRAFLRQDPDIIFIGEMRDYETGAIAVRAALTGHLLLSTIHTNNCASTVSRLVEMGIEPYLIASALRLVISQRLVRRICEDCKEELPLKEAERLDLDESTLADVEHLYRGKGCGQCNGIGYFGRAPVFEVMPIRTDEMRGVITEAGTEDQVMRVARSEGFKLLKEEAIAMVNEGVTTLDEALRIIIME